MIKCIALPVLLGVSVLLAGCSSQPTVSYVNPDGVDTTAIGYSSTDLQTITSKMVDSMLTSPSVVQITKSERPTIYFQGIQNRTDQHIDTIQLSNAVSTRLIQSGKFQFLDMRQAKDLKKQLQYQHESGMVDQKTAVKIGQQLGAKYLIYGYITSINQRNSSQQSMYLQVTMTMQDIQTGVLEWQGEKQIRKIESRSSIGW